MENKSQYVTEKEYKHVINLTLASLVLNLILMFSTVYYMDKLDDLKALCKEYSTLCSSYVNQLENKIEKLQQLKNN